LVDVDLDCHEAVLIGPDFLPPTGAIFGREDKPRSHYLFIAQDLATRQYRDTNGKMVLELRSTGTQTIWPPSVADEKRRAWDQEGEPARIEAGELVLRAGRLAAAALLARHWPAPGARHEASLALAGGLLRAGWTADELAAFVWAVARAAGDDEPRDRVKSVATTARRMEDDKAATGWPRLSELVGVAVVGRVCEWLGIHPGSGRTHGDGADEARHGTVIDPPEDEPVGEPILVNGRFMRDVTHDALVALQHANDPVPTVFRRGDLLVHVARRPLALEARALRPPGLKGLLDRAANFVREREIRMVPVIEPARPPDDVVADILALPPDKLTMLPQLAGISASPLVLPDGRILLESGYDQASGYLLDLGGLEGVRDDIPVEEAARLLADELLVDFPFADDASLAHTIAMLVQPFVRPLIAGPTPMYMIEAPAQGTGKGLLAEVAGVVAEGRDPAIMTLGDREEETDKRITALLVASASTILLDNVAEIRSSTLAAALTASTWRGRLLGRSEMANVPNTATWIATGNNIELSIENGRRVVPIRLDAQMAHPEERDEFRHPLPAWAYEQRVELVSACLSLVRSWQEAGKPPGTAALGRYESWVQVVGGIVALAGFEGFLANRADRVAAADSESAEWTVLIQAWWDRYREERVTAGPLLRLAAEQRVLLDLFVGRTVLGGMQRLGHALSARRDTVIAAWAIRQSGRDAATGSLTYRLEEWTPSMGGGQGHVGGRRETPGTPGTPTDQERKADGVCDDSTRNPPGVSPKAPGVPHQAADETPAPRSEPDQRAGPGPPGVSGVSGVSGYPAPDSSSMAQPVPAQTVGRAVDMLTSDVTFIAMTRQLTLNPCEVARRLLADHPELSGMDNVERLTALTSILRERYP
jgi:hypothetical protein